ncbi:MAG TPA: ATP-binding protein, partial [Anaerolineales bacterium]|nr:ATP-binding protein [Anaerolineales bacterium]
KIFERYYQIDQGDSRNYEGLGVGLSIARAIFENLGASLNILDSKIGCRIQALIPKPSMQGMFNG